MKTSRIILLVAATAAFIGWQLHERNALPEPIQQGLTQVEETLSPAPRMPSPKLVAAARSQIGQTVRYDPAYEKLAYPMGDVPRERGVCTDVVIRAMREQNLDLQQMVHQDMKRHFPAYPKRWGLSKPDTNIDHRRVPNLITFFTRQGWAVQGGDLQAGDILTWDLNINGRRLPHIGIVSDRKSASGRPLIIHNVGAGTQEEDFLRHGYPQTGHFRVKVFVHF